MANIRHFRSVIGHVGSLAVRVARVIAVGTVLLAVSTAAALAAVLTVTTAADDITPNDGSVSLREAITAVNAGNDLGDPDITAQSPGVFGINDTINFNIPGSGVHTITIGTDASASGIPLPDIIRPVAINGYSQGGASANTLTKGDNAVLLIQLNGASAGAGANGLELAPPLCDGGSAGSSVRGLVINRFSANGIAVESHGNTIAGNFIGTDPSGNASGPGNGEDGVVSGVPPTPPGTNTIGGQTPADRNVISCNGAEAIDVIGGLVVNQGNLLTLASKNSGKKPCGP